MHLGVIEVLAIGLTLVALLVGSAPRSAQAAAARPSIVMFYMDDWSPDPASLWDHPRRTPWLARFAEHGLEFENAIVSTPLCGPARASVLSGRYSHITGVTGNETGRHTAPATLAARLGQHGYHTVFIGKHRNGLARQYPTRSRMAAISNDWDAFDVIWHNQGRYYGWRQYRKDGTFYYGRRPSDHSSYQAAARAVSHIRSTPRDEPLFMMISLYDGHRPLNPMPRFKDHPYCRDFPPWHGPAYTEHDVSDKPRYIQETGMQWRWSYALRRTCEQAMSVDWVVGRVEKALRRAGRLDDTLQILTADNGWVMGDHRVVGKTYPYSTPVPLYLYWPRVLGHSGRVVAEPVSNVDFASTFCALAGCAAPDADGKNLLPLIYGRVDRLDRRFLYTEMLHAGPNWGDAASARPAWVGAVSTLGYSDTRWEYTRYQTGEEELYDVSSDPYRLTSLAHDTANAGVIADMRDFVDRIWDRDHVRWRRRLPK